MTPLCHDLEESWDDEIDLAPPGYVNGLLMEYCNFCANPKTRTIVDCRKCKQVYVDINPHEMKCIDDQKEEFQVILMVKFWWLDPDLKNLLCRVRLDDQHGELIGTLQQLTSNGDLQLRSKDGRVWTLLRGDYQSKIIEGPEMQKRFFPHFTLGNIQGEATELLQRYDFLWSHEEIGTFVSWEQKIDAIFAESLELQNFPLDRQLCRVKLIAEKPIEEFQFVMMKKDYPSRFSRVCDTFDVDLGMQQLCTAYVRYSDLEVPFRTQRSMVKVIFHLDRKGRSSLKSGTSRHAGIGKI